MKTEPYEMDFADYLESEGGVYLPFPGAVEWYHRMEWCNSIWEALADGIRPPEHRVAMLLKMQEHLKAYLPAHYAVDYPTIDNPWLEGSPHDPTMRPLPTPGNQNCEDVSGRDRACLFAM